MLVKGFKDDGREAAIRSLINLWLKDKRKSCAYCGRTKKFHECSDCETPPLMNNKQILAGFSEELKKIRETRANKHGSNESKSLRLGVSIPSGLYVFLDSAFQRMYNERLINETYDVQWFMKRFNKYFTIPEEV